jgi:hypothetical protein
VPALGPDVAAKLERAIVALAGRQRGYVTRAQLLNLGLGPKAIDYRIRKGILIPVHTGVYAVGHVPITGVDRAFAAVLACGPGAVLGHGTAASLWGVDQRWRTPFEVIVSTARRRPGIRTHRVALTRRDIRKHNGIRVTSPARTILDIAPRLTDARLKRAVNDLRIARHLRIADLAEAMERYPRHPGTARVRPTVEVPQGPTRSRFEDAFIAFCARYGLPTPEVNTRVLGYEVDALFPVERVIVELDGYDFHRTRDAFESDRDRDATTLAGGLPTVRITWERLTDLPEKEATRLHGILAARRT